MNRQPVDASPQDLTTAYEAILKPPPPAIQTPDGNNPNAQLAGQLEEFARRYRAAVIATIGDFHPEQMPGHLRDALWIAIAAHDAICQAASSARRNAQTGLLIATGR